MPGLRMVVLMIVPVVLALVLYGYLGRTHRSVGYRWRAVWLVPLAVLVHVLADAGRVHARDPEVVNRLEALAVLVILVTALWSNVEAVSQVWSRVALLGVVGGAGLNALAMVFNGDVILVPHGLDVLSVGDVLVIAGLSIALALYLLALRTAPFENQADLRR